MYLVCIFLKNRETLNCFVIFLDPLCFAPQTAWTSLRCVVEPTLFSRRYTYVKLKANTISVCPSSGRLMFGVLSSWNKRTCAWNLVLVVGSKDLLDKSILGFSYYVKQQRFSFVKEIKNTKEDWSWIQDTAWLVYSLISNFPKRKVGWKHWSSRLFAVTLYR